MNAMQRVGSVILTMITVLLATLGCGGTPTTSGENQGPPGGPGRGGPGGPIKQVMRSMDKGPNSLNSIKDALKKESPAWDVIQPKTADYAKQAAQLGPMDPPKGSKESWAKLTASFSALAEDLDKATQAKNLEGARAAQEKLSNANTCKKCHDEHRGGPGGFGPGRGGPGRPGETGAPPG